MQSKCIYCNHDEFEPIFHRKNVPVRSNSPLKESEFSQNILGTLDIVYCNQCGLVFNREFNSNYLSIIYDENYSSGLPLSQNVLDKYHYIVDWIDENVPLKNKISIEVGASDFTFSKLLLKKHVKKVIAIDPSPVQTPPEKVELKKCYFPDDSLIKDVENADIIFMRHILEHVPLPIDTIQFLKSIKENAFLYVEVPRLENILNENKYYDFIYEHVSYFSSAFLHRLFQENGFNIINETMINDSQHVGMLVSRTLNQQPSSYDHTLNFNPALFHQRIDEDLSGLASIINDPGKTAIYGAGNHAIYTAAYLNLNPNTIVCLFDINPKKQGYYSPGTLIPITTPTVDKINKLDTIIIMAALHQNEIYTQIRNDYSFKGDIYGLYPKFSKL
jgi:hypothetical protein